MALLSVLAVAWHLVIWCEEGEVLLRIRVQDGYLLSLLDCNHRPWSREVPRALASMNDGQGTLDNAHWGAFLQLSFGRLIPLPPTMTILKISKEHWFREFRGWMRKDPRCSECGRHSIIWKSKESVAFLFFIFKFLAICMRNYSSKSKLSAFFYCSIASLTVKILSKWPRKLGWKMH